MNAAGSLTNTLLALCRVGQAATQAGQGQQLSIAAACLGGDDALGFFYRRQLENTGVELLTEPQSDSHTGMSKVLCDLVRQYCWSSIHQTLRNTARLTLLAESGLSIQQGCKGPRCSYEQVKRRLAVLQHWSSTGRRGLLLLLTLCLLQVS